MAKNDTGKNFKPIKEKLGYHVFFRAVLSYVAATDHMWLYIFNLTKLKIVLPGQVLHRHMRPLATILNSTAVEHSQHCRKFY